MTRKLQEFIDKHGTSAVGNDPDAVYFDPQYLQIDEVVSCINPNCRHSTLSSPSELLETYDDGDNDIGYVIRWKGLPQEYQESWNDLKEYADDIFNYWQSYNSSSNSTSVNTKTYGRRTKKASVDNTDSATDGNVNDDDHDSHSHSQADEDGDNNDNNDDNDNDNDDDGQYNDRINSQGFPTQESIDLLTQDIFGDMDDDDEIDDNEILRNTQEYADVDDEDIDTSKKKGSKSKKAIVYKEDNDDEQDDDSLGLGQVDDNDSDYDGPTVKRKSKGRRAKAVDVDDDDGTGALMNAQKAKAIVNEEVDAITAIDTDSNKPSAAKLLTSKWKDDDDDRVEESMALLQESTLKQFEKLGLDLHKQRFELKTIKAWYQSDKDEQSKKWFNEEKKRIFEKMDKKKVPILLSPLLSSLSLSLLGSTAS